MKKETPKIRYSYQGKFIEDSTDFDKLVTRLNLQTQDKIVLLTKQNAVLVENAFVNDDDYFPFSQIIYEYYGKTKVENNIDRALFALAREIDRDNSTNVWRYATNRDSLINMVAYLANPETGFFQRLEEGDITLPDEISVNCGPGLKSLSSKMCKYLCDFLFQKDNYYINDSYVRHLLLFYLDFYHVPHPELKSCEAVDKLSYQELFQWLARLHDARNQAHHDTITKNEQDHILWYCYKSFSIF